ncbi:uracil-DNA glycosylase [Candidatus Gracilibacteria bacterium]|nr:uracil-DNA glycosylase [Candidatus Gracilibacteria bacterium]
MEINPKIDASWLKILKGEFEKDYIKNIKEFLIKEKKEGKTIYPAGNNIFNALNLTPFDQVKVVILGQDPYHGVGQAHGLSFSVLDGIRNPPSLQNIFKELKNDIGAEIPTNGNLEAWARQGVLLLNAALTVRAGEPASHSKIGWEILTDAIISKISSQKSGIVFMLWGAFAQSKENLIDSKKHLILKAPHPSPFSAHKGFFGCKHFSKTNEYLQKNGIKPINWRI